MDLYKLLKDKGYISKNTGSESEMVDLLNNKKTTFYLGVDPTAPSLHIGHLFSIIFSTYLINQGHKCIYVMGGGTVKLGDPSGRAEARRIMSQDEIDKNKLAIENQIRKILSNISYLNMNINQDNITFVDNSEWLDNLNYIEFIRDIGKEFSVNEMIKSSAYRDRLFEISDEKKDSNTKEEDLEKDENLNKKDIKFLDNGTSLSFTEFNYQLLQAYDFLYLYNKYNCNLQIGGADQWTNVLRGADLIKAKGGKCSGLLFNLIVDKDGNKMGKSQKGALFLSAEIISEFDFYQFFINVPDEHVSVYFKNFTFLDKKELDEIFLLDIREQKKILAHNMTVLVHGQDQAKICAKQSQDAFSGDFSNVDNFPRQTVSLSEFLKEPSASSNLKNLITFAKLCKSNSELKTIVASGGLQVYGQKLSQDDINKDYKEFLKDGKIAISIGKKRLVIEFKD